MPAARSASLVAGPIRPRLPVTRAAATAPAWPPSAWAIRRVSALRASSSMAASLRRRGGATDGVSIRIAPSSEPTAPIPWK